LVLLVLLFLLSSLVYDFLVPNEAHLFGVAVLHVQSKLRLEEHIACEVFGLLALVLLVEVHEGLLGARNDLDLRDISLTGTREIDLKLFLCGARWEVLDEEAEEHDRLFVLEVLHQQVMVTLLLLFCLSNIDLCKFGARGCFLFSSLCRADGVVGRFSGRRLSEADKTKALGFAIGITHDAGILHLSKLSEHVGKILICEAGILGEVLDVKVIETLFHRRRFLALVLEDSQGALFSVAFTSEVVLVELKRSGLVGELRLTSLMAFCASSILLNWMYP